MGIALLPIQTQSNEMVISLPKISQNESEIENSTNSNETSNSSESTNQTTSEGIDLVKGFQNLFSSWGFWAFFTFMILFLADYQNHPIVKCENKNGKMHRIGRFITETDEPKLNKKKFLFLSSDGLKTVYCSYSFRGLDSFCFQRVYVIEWDYPHLLLTKLKVPENQIIKNDIPILPERNNKAKKVPPKNRILWIVFKLFCYTPFRHIALGIYNAMDREEQQMQEVDYLIPWNNMDSIEYRFNVKYELRELDADKGQMMWIPHEKPNLGYNDILALKKLGDIQKLEITLAEVKEIHYPSLKEAQEDKHSRLEITNANENRTIKLEATILELEAKLQLSHEVNQKQKLELDEKVRTMIKPFEDNNEFLRNSFPDLLSQALSFRSLGMNEAEAIQNAIKTHLEKNDKEKNELIMECAELRNKIKQLETRPSRSPINSNELVIKNDKGEIIG